MASVSFKKNNYTSAYAMIAHMTRHDGDKNVEYSNKFIDKDKSHLNYIIEFDETTKKINVNDDFFSGKSTNDTFDFLKKKVQEIDEVLPPKRKRKDRVTVMTYTITTPPNLPPEKEHEFFAIAYHALYRFSGGYISQGYVHLDEIHDYIDDNGKVCKSRPHMHVAGIPFVKDVGVNGKAFETRGRMRMLNNRIDELCRERLGFAFMTGKRGKTGRSVEDLQASSEVRAVIQAINSLNQEKQELDNLLQEKKREVSELNDTATFLRNDISEIIPIKEKLKGAQKDIQEAKRLHELASEMNLRAEKRFIDANTYLSSLKSKYEDFGKDTKPLEVEAENLNDVKEKSFSPFGKKDTLRDMQRVIMFDSHVEDTSKNIDDAIKLFDETSISDKLPEIDLSVSPPKHWDERKQKPIQPKQIKSVSMAERLYEQAFQQVQGNYKSEDDYEME